MIEVKNVKKSYRSKHVLKDISFSVNEGDICALIGVNGAGKSTLVESICSIRQVDDGQIFVDKVLVNDKKNKKVLNMTIGYMSQFFGLFGDLTVRENLEYFGAIYKISDGRVDEIIKLCYLNDYEKALSKNLSGGYKQLLSLAVAIIHSPKVLILDEPTSNMDPLFRKNFWTIIKKLNKTGVTILLITHFIEELLECKTMMCLSSGKIVYSGEVKDFKKDGFINIEDILKKFGGVDNG